MYIWIFMKKETQKINYKIFDKLCWAIDKILRIKFLWICEVLRINVHFNAK